MALTAPTPPTPPTIDKGDAQTYTPRIDAHQFFEVPQMPFHEEKNSRDAEEKIPASDKNSTTEKNSASDKNSNINENVPVKREVTTPEDMARDAVANGAGALTKRTVTDVKADKPAENSTSTNQQPIQSQDSVQNIVPVVPPASTSNNYERGQAVLREFEEVDKSGSESSAVMSTPAPSVRNIHAYEESHGGIFWIVTLIIVVAAAFIVAKKFLFTDKPALKKSDLFVNSSEQLKSTAEKFSKAKSTATSAVKVPPPVEKKPSVKPVTLPKKDDDGKGKRFEVRV